MDESTRDACTQYPEPSTQYTVVSVISPLLSLTSFFFPLFSLNIRFATFYTLLPFISTISIKRNRFPAHRTRPLRLVPHRKLYYTYTRQRFQNFSYLPPPLHFFHNIEEAVGSYTFLPNPYFHHLFFFPFFLDNIDLYYTLYTDTLQCYTYYDVYTDTRTWWCIARISLPIPWW